MKPREKPQAVLWQDVVHHGSIMTLSIGTGKSDPHGERRQTASKSINSRPAAERDAIVRLRDG